MKSVFNMTGNMGRKRRVSSCVVTGNGQGLAGFGFGKAIDGQVSLKSAKNRAGQKLMYIERYKDHTGKIIIYFKNSFLSYIRCTIES